MNINFFTSFLFLVPAFYSWYRNVISICIACCICFITSIIYHGLLDFYANSNFTNPTNPNKNTNNNNNTTNNNNNTNNNTLLWYARIIDIISCHICTLFFLTVSIGFNIWYLYTVLCVYYIYIVYYECNLSCENIYSDYWHSSIHLSATLGICFCVESYLIS
jgi:hypothetical protein